MHVVFKTTILNQNNFHAMREKKKNNEILPTSLEFDVKNVWKIAHLESNSR